MSNAENWASDEFQTVEVGDKRRKRRLIKVAGRLASTPRESIPTAMEGWNETQAAYRLFNSEHVTLEKILDAHAEQTQRRIAKHPLVLVLQDTTELDLTTKRHKNKDVGPLNYKNRQGFLLHPSIVVTPEGLQLGTIQVKTWARDGESLGRSNPERKKIPFEEKESVRWRDGYEASRAMAEGCPGTMVVNVADRESDIFEYLVEATNDRPENARFVIRATQNRATTEPDVEAGGRCFVKLRDRMEATNPCGEAMINVPKRDKREARTTTLEIRTTTLELKPPLARQSTLRPVTVGVVWAKEKDPPEGEAEPIEWLLFTDLPADGLDAALLVLEYYAARWQIEVFFRVLKSGCKVEELEFHSFETFGPCLMVYMVVSWRVLNLMMLGRECPDLPCDSVLTQAEWQSAWQIIRHEPPPRECPSLGEMILIIASFGGHLGRKCDGPPGPKSLWIGLQRVTDFALAWTAFGPAANGEQT